MEANTTSVIRSLIFNDPIVFVCERRGHKNTNELESAINGSLLDRLTKGTARWSAFNKARWQVADGEMVISFGLRKIPFTLFKRKWVQLYGNSVSDDFLIKKFNGIDKDEIIEDAENGRWIFIGISTELLEDWNSEIREALVWVNIGNPDWDMDCSDSFVSLPS